MHHALPSRRPIHHRQREPDAIGTLSAPNFSEAPVVAQLGHLGLLAEAQSDQSIDRLVDLLISGAIVTVRPHERVRVVEDALTAVRVEVLDGSGRSGWAPSAWLRLEASPVAEEPAENAMRRGAA